MDTVIMLEKNIGGYATPHYFKDSLIKEWLDGEQSLDYFLSDYTSDDVEALLDYRNKRLKEENKHDN